MRVAVNAVVQTTQSPLTQANCQTEATPLSLSHNKDLGPKAA